MRRLRSEEAIRHDGKIIAHGRAQMARSVGGGDAVRRVEVERLVKQAERDLVNARKNIGIAAYEVAAFLAEQAVEKHLKAAWMVVKREAAPHTHSLTELGAGLAVPPEQRPHLVYLNPDYTVARYPDAANGVPYEVYDRDTAERKVAAAEEVFQWLRRLTPTTG